MAPSAQNRFVGRYLAEFGERQAYEFFVSRPVGAVGHDRRLVGEPRDRIHQQIVDRAVGPMALRTHRRGVHRRLEAGGERHAVLFRAGLGSAAVLRLRRASKASAARCKSPVVRGHEAQLANDPCANCGSSQMDSELHDVPAGYLPLLRLMYRALQGQAPELSPTIRAHPLLREHPSTWGSESAGAEAQVGLRAILNDWSAPSMEELGARLGSNWIWSSDPVRGRSIHTSPFFVQAAAASAELQRVAA